MGHERHGLLPKTARWRGIVTQIAAAAGADFDVSGVSAATLGNVRQRFRNLALDEGTTTAFRFLVSLAVASQNRGEGEGPSRLLSSPHDRPTPLKLTRALQDAVAQAAGRPEYGAIAEGAAADALAAWYEAHVPRQADLFGSFATAEEVWAGTGNGAGFCELSRLFIGKLTERYLNYFLEREASQVLPSAGDRERFSQEISAHLDRISQHAFETAKTAQSYSAGWFNRNAIGGMPAETEIRGFLSYAYAKMRDELVRESRD
jgi:hypothetical protein